MYQFQESLPSHLSTIVSIRKGRDRRKRLLINERIPLTVHGEFMKETRFEAFGAHVVINYVSTETLVATNGLCATDRSN